MRLSRLFQDNQHKLNETPPPQVWHRLERRLAEQRRYRKMSIFRQAASIAALLVLGALIALFGLLAERQNTYASYTPAQLEDLNAADGEYTRVVEFVRAYRDQLSRPLADGDRSRRISLSGDAARAIRSQLKVSLSDFNWLKGAWKTDLDERQALEIWARPNAQSFTGQAFLIEAGDTAAIEQMRIFQSGDKLFFETNLYGNQPTRYTLQQFFADRVLFENKEMAFPQQIIFELQSPRMLVITMQNEAYFAVDQAVADQLAKRNTMSPQRVVRVLERVE